MQKYLFAKDVFYIRIIFLAEVLEYEAEQVTLDDVLKILYHSV